MGEYGWAGYAGTLFWIDPSKDLIAIYMANIAGEVRGTPRNQFRSMLEAALIDWNRFRSGKGTVLELIKSGSPIPPGMVLFEDPPIHDLHRSLLSRVFTPKTRVVLFNNPLNPSATVFPRENLELLARYCEKFDAIAVCDEVWEHVMFDGRRHIPLIAMPGMRERCVKIGSAGKIFSLTGWKVGLVCAAPKVLRVLAKAHQYITFTTPPNLQAAVAYGLSKADDYFEVMRGDLQRSRVVLRRQAGEQLIDGLLVLGDELALQAPLAGVAEQIERRAAQALQGGEDLEQRPHPGAEAHLARLAGERIDAREQRRREVVDDPVVALEHAFQLAREFAVGVQPRHFVLVLVRKQLRVVARYCFGEFGRPGLLLFDPLYAFNK